MGDASARVGSSPDLDHKEIVYFGKIGQPENIENIGKANRA